VLRSTQVNMINAPTVTRELSVITCVFVAPLQGERLEAIDSHATGRYALAISCSRLLASVINNT
jgi:hypothetical protein